MRNHFTAGVLCAFLLGCMAGGVECAAQAVKPTFMLNEHTGKVRAGAFSPDGKWLATYGDDLTVRLWDTATGQQAGVAAAPGPDDVNMGLKHIVFSADGTLLAASGPTNRLMVWSVPALNVKRKLSPRGVGWFSALAISPDDTTLAFSGGREQQAAVYVYDLTTGTPVTVAYPRTQPMSLAYSHDGKMLACGQTGFNGEHRNVTVVDPATGKELFALEDSQPSQPMALSFSADDKLLAADEALAYNPTKKDLGAGWHVIKVWDIASRKMLYKRDGAQGGAAPTCLAFSGDGKTLMHADHGLDFNDVASGSDTRRFDFDQPLEALPLAISGDGSMFAAAAGRLVKVWKIDATKQPPGSTSVLQMTGGVASKPMDAFHDGQSLVIQGHENTVRGIVFSSDSARIYTAAADGTMRSWDAVTGAPGFNVPYAPVEEDAGLYLINGGKSLLYGPNIYDAQTGKPTAVLGKIKYPWPGPISMSADGKTMSVFAATDKIGAIEMVDIASGAVTGAIPLLQAVDHFAISSDGKYVAAEDEGTLKILDIPGGRELGKVMVRMDGKPIFSADGKMILIMSDRPVILEVPTLKFLCNLSQADEDSVAAFSPDGRLLALTEEDRIRVMSVADVIAGK